ncbi:BQ2448_3422 [Microbotryum intermedium]|uniref:BQ2448_3422 protein n=1 Tax=Microbotryum intermedium TaxID=269621 RepID=A0A238F9Z3_9BASI|nr:BQ2448_3422 [Microbotryum intermedium]
MQTGDPESLPGAPPPPVSAPPTVPIGMEKTQLTNVVGQNQTYAAATTATITSKQTPEQQKQQEACSQALPGIMAAIQAVPRNCTDRWVQAIFATKDYPSTAATSLKFSALNATRNIVNPFNHALEVTLSHQSSSKASVKDKGDLVACIIGLQHSLNLRAGAIHHCIMVGFASAEACDAALATPPTLTWHSAKARFAKAHHFHRNMVELRINVGFARINVDNATAYAHTVGDFLAFVHFDDASLFLSTTSLYIRIRVQIQYHPSFLFGGLACS